MCSSREAKHEASMAELEAKVADLEGELLVKEIHRIADVRGERGKRVELITFLNSYLPDCIVTLDKGKPHITHEFLRTVCERLVNEMDSIEAESRL